jgi:hypothetical protein
MCAMTLARNSASGDASQRNALPRQKTANAVGRAAPARDGAMVCLGNTRAQVVVHWHRGDREAAYDSLHGTTLSRQARFFLWVGKGYGSSHRL